MELIQDCSLLIFLLCGHFAGISGSSVLCYYNNMAQFRPAPHTFTVENIDARLCTHVVFAYAQIDDRTNHIVPSKPTDTITYEDFTALKQQNPNLKTLLAVGGWNHGSCPFSSMTSSMSSRNVFAQQSITFLQTFGFDGLELNWQYPMYSGTRTSTEVFSNLLMEMSPLYRDAGLLLTATVSAGRWIAKAGYNAAAALNTHLDLLSVMAYDLHAASGSHATHRSPLNSNDGRNMKSEAEYWVLLGISKEKLLIGLATSGQSFTLSHPKNTEKGAPISGPGPATPYIEQTGSLAYYEICELLDSTNRLYTKHWIANQKVPYIENGRYWIGYDDMLSILFKINRRIDSSSGIHGALNWIQNNKYGGVMVSSLDTDDFTGQCRSYSVVYPLTLLIHETLLGKRLTDGDLDQPCLAINSKTDTGCTDPLAVCTGTTKVCKCSNPSLMVVSNGKCRNVKYPGERCSIEDMCMNSSYCNPFRRRCKCRRQFYLSNSTCFAETLTTQAMKTTTSATTTTISPTKPTTITAPITSTTTSKTNTSQTSSTSLTTQRKTTTRTDSPITRTKTPVTTPRTRKGNATESSPPRQHNRVCYYSNWSRSRQGNGQFDIEDIDPFLCTHLIYSFANLDGPSYELSMSDPFNDEKLYVEFNDLKRQNPDLKTLLAVGGWNAASTGFSNMVTDPALRQKFASTSVGFLRSKGFDGLDLDWEYPTMRDGGQATDKDNFINLLEDLIIEFEADAAFTGLPRLLLTVAVSAGKATIDQAYDIPRMHRYLDFINIMTYDFHGSWEQTTGHNSPLYARDNEGWSQSQLTMEFAANYWVRQGTPKEKVIVGLATYGRTFHLANSAKLKPGNSAVGPGLPGTSTGSAGFLAYYEICIKLDNGTGTRHWDFESKVPYLVDGNQWIGYDDTNSFIIKLNWIRDEGFGGAMVWNIDLDDFKQVCPSSSRPYPLMSLMEEVLSGYVAPLVETTPVPTKPVYQPTTQPTGNEFSCTGLQNGLYTDPNHCYMFYHCWLDTTYHKHCPPGLLWNQEKKNCDWKHNVDCGSR